MRAIAAGYARAGWRLRTGGSPGADAAFAQAALEAGGAVELYLPWPGFGSAGEGRAAAAVVRVRPSPGARALAARVHPGWACLAERERALLARDGHQVLGAALDRPARFVLCWTADGSLDGAGLFDDRTGQTLRVAHRAGVPVFNLGRRP